jgi:hypothetical protein
MSEEEFDQYHDFAAGLKTRGSGIGFAGVGAKVAFNIARKVRTRTRSNSFSGGSNWYLQSDRKLLWEDIPVGSSGGTGTSAEIIFMPRAHLSYSSTEDLVQLLKRHYLPLLDPNFLILYETLGLYSRHLRFCVNGITLEPTAVQDDLEMTQVHEFTPRRAGKRVGYGLFGLASSEYPVGADLSGILLCTHGKLVKGDLFNQFPGELDPRIAGVVEVPGFVHFLTTAKTDFMRRGRHREFEGLYDPVRQEFKAWLGRLGVQTPEPGDRDEAGRLERELKKILDEVPELSDFFGFRHRKSVPLASGDGEMGVSLQEGAEPTIPVGTGEAEGAGIVEPGHGQGEALVPDAADSNQRARPISRVGRRGPRIAFASAPDRLDLAWVDGSDIVINTSHPSYTRVQPNPLAKRLHCLFAIGSAVQRFMRGEKDTDLMFVDRMMSAWGRR